MNLEWYGKSGISGMWNKFDYSQRISLIRMPEWYAKRAGGSLGVLGEKCSTISQS